MTTHLELRGQILSELKNIIAQTLCNEDVTVYLFGSWARNEEKQSSDIDIAVESHYQLPLLSGWNYMNELKNLLYRTT